MKVLPYRKPLPGSPASVAYQRILADERAMMERPAVTFTPAVQGERSRNPLRPRTFDEIVGQDQAKHMIEAAMGYAKSNGEALPHMLLIGPAGTGKSTLAHVVATEMGVEVYQLAAPVSQETLLALREVMRDHDILFVDEIHLQAIQERRGRESITSPEVLYGVLEDQVIPTATGVLPFPAITMIGGTTDEGMLSDAFLSRFPLRPRMTDYTLGQLAEIAVHNAKTLGAALTPKAAGIFAVAARGTPREVNNLLRNAIVFGRQITAGTARQVLKANGIEEKDGLSADMAALLRFVYLSGRQRLASGEVRYRASVNSIATGIGKSRDSKSVIMRIEPYLIRRGYIGIMPGGRQLTDAGVKRAKELVRHA